MNVVFNNSSLFNGYVMIVLVHELMYLKLNYARVLNFNGVH